MGFLITACNYELEENVYSQRTYDNYFRNVNDYNAFLNGTYRTLKNWQFYMQNFILSDLGMSDIGGGTTDGGEWFELIYSGITPTSAQTGPWSPAYKAISQCNTMLGSIEMNANLSEAEKKWVKGQALFIRAHTYFCLVQMYGGVPLHLTEVKSEAEAAKPRSTEKAVYDQIVADLEEAQTLLPAKYSENLINGRQYAINQTCAAVLSRVYLTMAGKPLSLGTPYFEKAREKALSVINSNTYRLLDNYAHLWDLKHENSEESIIELDFIQIDEQGTALPSFTAPRQSLLSVNGFGTLRLRKKFVQDWRSATCENGFTSSVKPDGSITITEMPGVEDYRYSTTLINEFTTKSGAKMICFPKSGWQTTNDKHTNYSFLSKYCDANAVSQNGHGNNVMLMRFAEVYLIFAEAQNEVAGPQVAYQGLSPLAALNKLRERARKANGVAREFPKDLTSNSKEEFRRKVFEERGWELVGEGLRYFDLKRTGLYKEMLEADKGGLYGTYRDLPKVYNARCYYFPIPASEVQQNPLIEENNPGY